MVYANIELYKQGETGQSGATGVFLYITPITVQFKVGVVSGDPTGFLWDFGDGTTSSLREPEHTYTSYGLHRVVLTVSDVDGSYVSPFFVLKLGKLDFSADPVRGFGTLLVNFVNQSVAPTGCHFTGAVWDFGDGYTGMVANPMHTYSTVDKYSVSLSAFLSDV
jgi:PKD repeat protein